MFVVYMLIAIVGMGLLILFLGWLLVSLIKGKKNLYSVITLIIVSFFLFLALYQGLTFFHILEVNTTSIYS
ncbi:hypothetical protein SM124_07145 [Bacillus sp. 31A1R]|uniref:NADH dehydrogenase subunit 6 n=1 Tax=Robertmurraya mangrovi TaxID=3098077 RepID=A0ABU5IWK9_9BACI|nr:hypothetical protein [Bacillus sp. 31A1R]MDZ5471521.1 hypothetical protein [Bacillus sp. 31A1R]